MNLKAQKQDMLRVKPSAREKGVWWKPLRKERGCTACQHRAGNGAAGAPVKAHE